MVEAVGMESTVGMMNPVGTTTAGMIHMDSNHMDIRPVAWKLDLLLVLVVPVSRQKWETSVLPPRRR